MTQQTDHDVDARDRLGRIVRPLLRQDRPGRIKRIALDLENCAEGWEADARLLGNVTAEEIRDLCQWVRDHAA